MSSKPRIYCVNENKLARLSLTNLLKAYFNSWTQYKKYLFKKFRNKLECLSLESHSRLVYALCGGSGAYSRVEHLEVIYSGRLWPYSQTSVEAGKAFLGQTL